MRTCRYSVLFLVLLAAGILSAGCITGTNQDSASAAFSAPKATAAPANYPDITGTWYSQDESGFNLNTTIQSVPIGGNTWVFTDQDRQIARGYKTFRQPDGSSANQTLLGIFDPDGKTLTILDQPGGSAKGTLTGPDTLFIVLTYTNGKDTGGNSFAMTMTLHRKKG